MRLPRCSTSLPDRADRSALLPPLPQPEETLAPQSVPGQWAPDYLPLITGAATEQRDPSCQFCTTPWRTLVATRRMRLDNCDLFAGSTLRLDRHWKGRASIYPWQAAPRNSSPSPAFAVRSDQR